MSLPLSGVVVLDFSQYLAGPSAALRLADLGARVIKIERTGQGDNSRRLKLHNLEYMGDSVLFQTINRNKESFCADLKSPEDLKKARKLIEQADVLIENFRPGAMEKIGLGYDAVKELNPRLVYATVTGYGSVTPWVKKPGQDLLAQSISGLTWLNGNDGQNPMPFALSVADSYAGVHLAEGIIACLFRRERSQKGGRVEVSLLESVLDLQFEVVSAYLNDGRKPPKRSAYNNAHAYLSAPYGIYQTLDGFIALAMGSASDLIEILQSKALEKYPDPQDWFTKRDEIKEIIGEILREKTTDYWMTKLEERSYWGAPVYSWDDLVQTEAFKSLDFLIDIKRPGGQSLYTSRCPITFGQELNQSSTKWAPKLGENTLSIEEEFKLLSDDLKSASSKTMKAEIFHEKKETEEKKPLEGITVLDLGQFLSAPSAGLRLADLGASVIKVENPNGGDICRRLYVSNCKIDDDSSLFHAINRNKDGVSLDLKNPNDMRKFHLLLEKADVILVNFRPGVAQKLGVDYSSICKIKKDIVYGEITGYGKKGPWVKKPGQDLLVQSLSGITYLNGNQSQPPTPLGLSVADLFAGQHLAQGILSALYRRALTGIGQYVHVSLLESILDIQFEVFTTYLNDGRQSPLRSSINNANAYISAPYGVYKTLDGYMAVSMVAPPLLAKLIDCPALADYTDENLWFSKRDEIKEILAQRLLEKPTSHWLAKLEVADVWCSDVLSWEKLFQTDGFQALDMIQDVKLQNGSSFKTTRCPITFDGLRCVSPKPAPKIGQDNGKYF